MTNEIQHPYLVVHSVIPFKKNFFAARTTLAREKNSFIVCLICKHRQSKILFCYTILAGDTSILEIDKNSLYKSTVPRKANSRNSQSRAYIISRADKQMQM